LRRSRALRRWTEASRRRWLHDAQVTAASRMGRACRLRRRLGAWWWDAAVPLPAHRRTLRHERTDVVVRGAAPPDHRAGAAAFARHDGDQPRLRADLRHAAGMVAGAHAIARGALRRDRSAAPDRR